MEALELIGSKSRLEILRALTRRDMYVTELKEEVGMDGKTATHHLGVLEEKGVIESYRDGRRRYYALGSELHVEISPSPNRRFVVQFTDVE